VIGRLKGIVVERAGDGCCVIDVNGVGYEVYVPMRTLSRLPAPPDEATLHVHMVVREDTLTPYGFGSSGDRAAFRALINVNGVGPRLALSILGDLSASELARAVSRGDKARFKEISGVGKKTAERIVLDLRDKLPPIPESDDEEGEAPPSPPGEADTARAAVGALIQMGFGRAEAERAVTAADRAAPGQSVEELLRAALGALA
jgi:Holliday junction DNA helicase RuvA